MGSAETTVMCLGAAWVLIFLGRLIIAPYQIAVQVRRQIPTDDGLAKHTAAIEAQTDELRRSNALRETEADPVRRVLLEAKAQSIRDAIANKTQQSTAANMTISLAARDECGADEPLADGNVRKSVYLIVRNIGSATLRGVRVYQERRRHNGNEYLGALPLFEGDIEIEPYNQACVKLAYRDERDISGMGLSWEGDFIVLCCPEGLGAQRLGQWGAVLRVRATSPDSAPCEIRVQLHVPKWGFSAEIV